MGDQKLFDTDLCVQMLKDWAKYADKHWYPIPGRPDLGCFGTGYNAWAVQTNQKYLAGLAALGVQGDEKALERALAALRFSLASHLSGDFHCTDGSQWGHTWISPLGIERMMYAVYLLEPFLTEADQATLRGVLISEAEWLLTDYERYGIKGIQAEVWENNGKNHPESNVWNGAVLWRTAHMYPDYPRAQAFQERAHQFLINAISVPEDAHNESILAGKTVKDRFIGPSFFPHFALDHRAFMNLGYMVICTSNAAMLHFDLQIKGLTAPETLYHHQGDLWALVRRMVFGNGRLARIGGNTRIRNTYTQEYLLPSLLLGADKWNDPHALDLADRYLEWAREEQMYNGDGSFYGKRLSELEARNPYYATRLEADRACVLGMAVSFAPLVRQSPPAEESFETSVAGSWCEAEHGSVLHRSPTRLASFVWRAYGWTQGLCQPPADGHLAEWDRNLGGLVEAVHHVYDNKKQEQLLYPHLIMKPPPPHRRLLIHKIVTFEGGFLTYGAVMEGVDIEIADGWSGTDTARHQLVFAALPDDHTVVGLQFCRNAPRRSYFREIQGMHLNLPNDLFNGFQRRLVTSAGEQMLKGPAETDELVPLGSRWVSIDDCLSAAGLYGAQELTLCRLSAAHRRRGEFATLNVEEIAWQVRRGCFDTDPDEVVLDVGWMIASGLNARETRAWAAANHDAALSFDEEQMRGVRVHGQDGRAYTIVANFADELRAVHLDVEFELTSEGERPVDMPLSVEPGQAMILV